LVFGPILILRASYREAVDLTLINPDLDPTDAIIATRRGRTKYGYYINVEQAVTEQVGLFGALELERRQERDRCLKRHRQQPPSELRSRATFGAVLRIASVSPS
jgi:hypothetical protein